VKPRAAVDSGKIPVRGVATIRTRQRRAVRRKENLGQVKAGSYEPLPLPSVSRAAAGRSSSRCACFSGFTGFVRLPGTPGSAVPATFPRPVTDRPWPSSIASSAGMESSAGCPPPFTASPPCSAAKQRDGLRSSNGNFMVGFVKLPPEMFPSDSAQLFRGRTFRRPHPAARRHLTSRQLPSARD
jgi:hypothetical protein